MKPKQFVQSMVGVVVAGLLAACSLPATVPQSGGGTPASGAASTPTPQATESPVAEIGTPYQPAGDALCEEVRALVAEVLGVEATLSEAPFDDLVAGVQGNGCQTSVSGTGEEFGNFVDVAGELRSAFAEAGWAEDMAYVADGPTGTAFAMRRDGALALFSVDWQPAEGVECPDDQPISACDIEPAQQEFTSTVNVAASAGSATQVQPLAQAECEAIQAALADALNVDWQVAERDFETTLGDYEGQSCTISATGTGEAFGNFLDVAAAMQAVLDAQGWTENQAYLADGPTGTAFGYERDGQLALGTVGWQPAEGVDCPEDQPISACEIEPAQQDFTVTLQLVQPAEPGS